MNIYNVRRRAISDYGKAAATYQPHRPELERLEPRILLSDVLPAAASFSVGDYVRTTVNVNVRTAAGTGNPEIGDPDYPGHAPAGSVGMVLKDPVSAGGLTWWRVDWGGVGAGAGSYQGWCAESVGSTVYLENARSTSRVCGIDVSHWQGTIDWSYVAGSGHAFAFVKATEGTGFTDSRLSTNMTGGGAAGMFMGPYHFARPDSAAGDAVAEASYFVSAAGPFLSKGYVRPVLDLEDGASLGKAALSDWVRDWMDAAEAQTGVEPIIYTSADYAANYLETSLSVYDLWVAHWTYDLGVPPSTGIWSTWDFWQYSGDNIAWPGNIKGATIPGISGAVDADLFNGTRSQLAAFVIGQATEPTITSSLTLTQSAPYYVGQTIDGQFAITNWGTSAVTFQVLTIGGRDPDDQVADFTWRTGVHLDPGQSYSYSGALTLQKPGGWHFFCAYRRPDGTWNPAIPAGTGVSNTKDITVLPLPVSISIGDASVVEGDIGTRTLRFTVNLSGTPQQFVDVDYATSNGTATAGSDYTAVSGHLQCAPGETDAFWLINVPIIGDYLIEGDDTFTITLSNPSNVVIADGQALGTILNDDVAGSIQFGSATYTVNENGGSASIYVTRTGGFGAGAGANYATSNGSAIAGSDYTATSGPLTFGGGETYKTFTVPIINDSVVETSKTVILALSAPTGGAVLGAPSTAVLTIWDDDAMNRPNICVLWGDEYIGDGQSPNICAGTDFGLVVQGQAAPSRTFTLRNTGSSDLLLRQVYWPSWLVLTEGLPPSLAPGASDTFTVQVQTATVGTFTGEISIDSNDPSPKEARFNFGVIATVEPPETPVPAILQATDPQGCSAFGKSADLSGDFAIVGAPQASSEGLTTAGAAYIYQWDGNGWVQVARLAAGDPLLGAVFGVSVAIDGDYALVGAHFAANPAGLGTGAAYVFHRSGSTWSQVAKLTAQDVQAYGFFGWAVALDGTRALVGANSGAGSSGAAYVFECVNSTWAQTAKLLPSDSQPEDRFGFAVALDGNQAAVANTGGNVYVFQKDGSAWIQTKELSLPSFYPWTRPLGLSGDFLAVGAPKDGTLGNGAGAVYVFQHTGSDWVQSAKLTATDGDPDDNLGWSVGISGDLLVAGAYGDENRSPTHTAEHSGSAYVFHRSGMNWTQTVKLVGVGTLGGDRLGSAVSVCGDRAIIGAVDGDLSGDPNYNVGLACLFDLGNVGPGLEICVWDGAADSRWENGANWSYGAVPGAGVVARIDGSAARQPVMGQDQTVWGLDLAAGAALTFAPGAPKTLVTKSLTIAESGGVPTARLDIGSGAIVIDYTGGANPIADVRRWILQAYNGMAWDSDGITSSAAALDPLMFGLGYTQNDMLFLPYDVFSGVPVDLSTVLVKFTYNGDVNLDGCVDDNDVTFFNLFYDGGISTSHYWNQGDIWGYDGRVDDNDVTILGLTYGLGIGSPLGGEATTGVGLEAPAAARLPPAAARAPSAVTLGAMGSAPDAVALATAMGILPDPTLAATADAADSTSGSGAEALLAEAAAPGQDANVAYPSAARDLASPAPPLVWRSADQGTPVAAAEGAALDLLSLPALDVLCRA